MAEIYSDLLFKYGKKLLIPINNRDLDRNSPDVKEKERYLCTLMHNMESYGFTFSQKAYEGVLRMSLEDIKQKGARLLDKLKVETWDYLIYKAMYPNFPNQVMKMSDFELYFNALVHYWSEGKLVPVYEKEPRFPIADRVLLKVIDAGDMKDLDEIMKNLTVSNVALPEHTLNDLRLYYELEGWDKALRLDIPNKENMSFICSSVFQSSPENTKFIKNHVKTATDVLRIAVALSNGDRSLAEKPCFRKFKRPEKRFLLGLLDKCKNLKEDMWRRPDEFKRFAEYLSARDYPLFKNANTAFESISKGEKPLFYNSRLEVAYKEKDLDSLLKLLSSRPGEFARKLDRTLRVFPERAIAVVNNFYKVASKVPNSTLLQVREHFLQEEPEYRIFFPKGNVMKAYNIKNDKDSIDEDVRKLVAGVCTSALKSKFKTYEPMGKVYLNPEFKNHVVPFALRSSNDTKVTMTRGSSIPIKDDAKTIRGFIWWTNNSELDRTDIDLSAVFYDKDWNYHDHVSYTNLRNSYAYHSGDFIDGGSVDGDGVAEFLDIDKEALKEAGIAYAVFQVHNYTGSKYSDMPNCKFGWMEREDMHSGELFEPKTVKQAMDLISPSFSVVPVIYDVERNRFIWADMTVGRDYNYGNNVENTLSQAAAACYSVVNMQKPNLYDLIKMHVEARGGVFTNNKEEADLIFDMEKDKDYEVITPYDFDVFISEYIEYKGEKEVKEVNKEEKDDVRYIIEEDLDR